MAGTSKLLTRLASWSAVFLRFHR